MLKINRLFENLALCSNWSHAELERRTKEAFIAGLALVTRIAMNEQSCYTSAEIVKKIRQIETF